MLRNEHCIYYCLENGVSRWGTPRIEFPGQCCSVRGESSLRAGPGSSAGHPPGSGLPPLPSRAASRWSRARLCLCLRSRPRRCGAGSEHNSPGGSRCSRDPKAKASFGRAPPSSSPSSSPSPPQADAVQRYEDLPGRWFCPGLSPCCPPSASLLPRQRDALGAGGDSPPPVRPSDRSLYLL